MPLIKPVHGVHPQFGENCFIADNATIVGQVVMGNDCSVWFNAVVRGAEQTKTLIEGIANNYLMYSGWFEES